MTFQLTQESHNKIVHELSSFTRLLEKDRELSSSEFNLWFFPFYKVCQAYKMVHCCYCSHCSHNKVYLPCPTYSCIYYMILLFLKELVYDSNTYNSGSSSILLNGAPSYLFLCTWGVHQGDPLSLLFVPTVDLLHCHLNLACQDGMICLHIPQPDMEEVFPIIQYTNNSSSRPIKNKL